MADEQDHETAPTSQQPTQRPSKNKAVQNITGKVIDAKKVLEAVGVLPIIQPVPCSTFGVLLIFVSVPPAGFTWFFSSIGTGEDYIASHDEDRETRASMLSLAIVSIMLCLYLMDFSYWESKISKMIRNVTLFCVAGMCTVYLLASARSMPHGLILLFSLGIVTWFIAMKYIFYYKVVFRDYVSWIAGPMLATSIITLIGWVYWVSSSEGNAWNLESKVRYGKRFDWDVELTLEDYTGRDLEQCRKVVSLNATSNTAIYAGSETEPYYTCMPTTPVNKTYFSDDCPPYCAQLYDNCTVSFMVWATPFVVALMMIFLSFMCAFLNPQSSASAPSTFGKVFMMLLFGLWCTASLSGAGAGINQSFSTFFLGASISIALIMVSTFGVPSNVEELNNLETFKNIKKKYGWMADFMKATLISTSSPIIAMYMCIAFLNQLIRRCGIFPFSVKLDKAKGEHKLWVTRNAMAQIVEFKRWDHAKVYNWAIIIGLTYMTMQVIAGKFTVLFLSWMKQECAQMSFLVVSLIIMGVGMTLFLLPPIPGVPIYLTGGLMIPAVATGIGANPNGTDKDAQFPGGIPAAVAYTCIVSLLLKLSACTLQQKAIGEPLSHKVWIRQLVGVNSNAIRTMKLVLQQPGLSIAKVAILVGGPDWPTSVFCGIMRLPLHQILLGTIPVFFLIVPTVLAGTFLWMSLVIDPVSRQPVYPWAVTVSTIFMLGAGTVQSGSMVVAAYHLEKAVETRGDELEAIPIDKEVFDADNRNKAQHLLYLKLTQWHHVPYFWKKVLHLGVFLQVCSCYITLGFVFAAPYSLTNVPSDLPGGKWYNLLTFYGWVSMAFFLGALICWYMFRKWAFSQVASYEKSGQPMPTVHDLEHELVEAGLSIAGLGVGGNTVVPEAGDDGKEIVS